LIVEVSARARAEFASAIAYLLDENPRAAEKLNAAIERAIDPWPTCRVGAGTAASQILANWWSGARRTF
jgi:plasmid stabilization system protein ParE